MSLPSIPQCLNRMSGIHARILDGEKAHPGMSLADARGWLTAAATCRRWGAIDGSAVTERGHELLTAWRARNARNGRGI